jgi:hypothetical protein
MTRRQDEVTARRQAKLEEDKLFAFRVQMNYLLRNPEYKDKLKSLLPNQKTIQAIANPPKRMPPAPPAPDLLTEEMLAARWHCSSSRLQHWRSHGIGIQYIKLVGRVLYRLEDVIEFEKNSLIRFRK